MDWLSKDALLEAGKKLPIEKIDVPELGGYVYVRGMSGQERDGWEKSLIRGRGRRRDVETENIRAKLAARCLVDEHGTRLFSDGEAILVGQVRVDVLQRIFEASQRLSGVSEADLDELGNASGPAAGIDSPMNSPGSSA